jgi:hypothetical protein
MITGWRMAIAAGVLFAAGTASLAGAAELTIAADNNPVAAGAVVTFTFAPKLTVTGDSVTFTFGDGSTGTVEYGVTCQLFGGCNSITHTYAGAGVFNVSAEGTIGGTDVAGSLALTVTESSNDAELFIATGAHGAGFNETVWRTDLEVHNYGTTQAQYAVLMLARGQDNTDAQRVNFTLGPGVSVRYGDVLQDLFSFDGQAALRIIPIVGSIMVTSRTYNQSATGTYGQLVPAVPRARAIAYGQVGCIIGVSHEPSLQTAFRTNLGILNVSPGPITVEASFYLANGAQLGTVDTPLAAYEFVQLDKAFELVTPNPVADGYILVNTLTPGAKFLAYGSVVDNVTGDPVFIPAMTGN